MRRFGRHPKAAVLRYKQEHVQQLEIDHNFKSINQINSLVHTISLAYDWPQVALSLPLSLRLQRA
jgi:hypothetical protein